MSTFSQVRAEVGLALEDIADNFKRSISEVRLWEEGGTSAPTHVLRTLELMQGLDRPHAVSTTAYGIEGLDTATRYPQKNARPEQRDVDPPVQSRQDSRPMSMDFSGAVAVRSLEVEPRLPLPPRNAPQQGEPPRPRLLDLFCCAGGAGVGYHRAGFDVVGVDIVPRPNYPFEFVQADAMKLDAQFLASFDAIHASPPCQSYSDLAKRNGNGHEWPRLIDPVRDMLIASGRPYVIENVEGSPLLNPVILCGTMFPGLRVIRHRLFEANFKIVPPPHKKHPKVHTFDKRKSHFGKTNEWVDFVQVTGGGNCTLAAARDAMGIEWMTKGEINEAIPPAYTELIGKQLIALINSDQVDPRQVSQTARA